MVMALGMGFVLLGALLTVFSGRLADGLGDVLMASPWFYRGIGIAFFAAAFCSPLAGCCLWQAPIEWLMPDRWARARLMSRAALPSLCSCSRGSPA